MIGIVADAFTGFNLILEGEGEGLYTFSTPGLLDDVAELLEEEKNENLAIMTKVGNDSEADMIEDWYNNYSYLDIRYYRSSIYPTAVALDAEMRYRYSALQDIRKEEVISFIDEKNVGTLIVAGALLSFKPVSSEILKAILERKDKLSSVIVDASISYRLLLLEEFKMSLESLVDNGVDVSIVGNPVSVEGVKGMSRDRLNELLLPLSEEEG